MCIQAEMKTRGNNHLNGKKNHWKLRWFIFVKGLYPKYPIDLKIVSRSNL